MKANLDARLDRLESTSAMAVYGGKPFANRLAEIEKVNDNDGRNESESLIAQIRQLQLCTLEMLDRAERIGRTQTALQVIREARNNLELLARLTGQFDFGTRSTVITGIVVLPSASPVEAEAMTIDIEAINR